MTSSWTKWGICVLSGVALAAGTAWGQAGPNNEPGVQSQAVLQGQATAESIISRDEAALGRKFDPQYRDTLKAAIGSLSPSEVAAIPVGSSPLALGDTSADLVYTPVAPCRIINFVFIPGNTSQSFFAAGLCGIPFPQAKAVMINLISVNPTGAGDLRAWAFGQPVPGASVLNYAPVSGLNIANGIVVPICDGVGCPLDLTIQADVSGTTVVADVFGYFAAPSPIPTLWAVVNSNGTLARGFHAVSSSNPFVGNYIVNFDRNISQCAFTASIGLSGNLGTETFGVISVVISITSNNAVFIRTQDTGGTNSNRGFHLNVMC